MKLLAILALIATSLLPVLPAAAATSCTTSGHDKPNHNSGLSSTSQGGQVTCGVTPS
jgi:hypothetical protein